MNEPLTPTRSNEDVPTEPAGQTCPDETARRAALSKIGRFSAYVAPAMLVMMTNASAKFIGGSGEP